MSGQLCIFRSANKIIDDDDIDIYPTKYFNAVDIFNLLPHELNLKVDASIILLRNLDPSAEMCNDTRMRVVRSEGRAIECEILTEKHAAQTVFIPRISTTPTCILLFQILQRLTKREDAQILCIMKCFL